ncbi:MAG: hypothetical protein JNG85_01475 [Spirochaetaceae bacterium]|nr:hypothetical protein [Spirochaetaceae bacterium]
MNSEELEGLARDIEALRRAIRKNDPLLRGVASSRFYAILSLPLGFFILAFFLSGHFLILERGSFEALPMAWKWSLWIFLALFLVVGGGAKVVFLRRRAAKLDAEAGFLSLVKAVYGGPLFNRSVPPLLACAAVSAFAVWRGSPWQVVPATALCFAFLCFEFGSLVERREYAFTGWYALTASLAALFAIESAPFLWTAVVYGGAFLVFGATGLLSPEGEG